MAKEYSRTQRIGDQMQRELAQLIRREIKDPRVGLVTITAVDVSRDVGHAKIFMTVMGQDSAEEIAQSIKADSYTQVASCCLLYTSDAADE